MQNDNLKMNCMVWAIEFCKGRRADAKDVIAIANKFKDYFEDEESAQQEKFENLTPINELKTNLPEGRWGTRIVNALLENDVRYIEQLKGLTEKEFLKFCNVSNHSLILLNKALVEIGYKPLKEY